MSSLKQDVSAESPLPYAPFLPLFHLLRLSPSYSLAKLAATGELTKEHEARIPTYFEEVRATYRVLGDVWSMSAGLWWSRYGRRVCGSPEVPQVRQLAYLGSGEELDIASISASLAEFPSLRARDGSPETIIVAIPVGNVAVLETLRPVIAGEHYHGHSPDFSKVPEQSQMDDLFEGIYRMYRRATSDEEFWKIEARLFDPENDRVQGLQVARDDPNKDKAEAKRRFLGQRTQSELKVFERYSENAARGRYPDRSKLDYPKFDYDEIGARLRSAEN